MVQKRFSGETIASVLIEMGYEPVERTGSHLKLRYVHGETGEIRNVTVPLGHEIGGNTIRNIAEQCGA
ncbi:MAG: type II toxin-antitoxin system HicA family toxin, partial [Halobaculum sp.]